MSLPRKRGNLILAKGYPRPLGDVTLVPGEIPLAALAFRYRLDSERTKPFVDIARLFAEKCHHRAFPRHIAKQRLFQSECHQRRLTARAFVLLAGRIRTRVWVYSGMLRAYRFRARPALPSAPRPAARPPPRS